MFAFPAMLARNEPLFKRKLRFLHIKQVQLTDPQENIHYQVSCNKICHGWHRLPHYLPHYLPIIDPIIAAGDWVAQVEFLQSQAFAFMYFHKILLTFDPNPAHFCAFTMTNTT